MNVKCQTCVGKQINTYILIDECIMKTSTPGNEDSLLWAFVFFSKTG